MICLGYQDGFLMGNALIYIVTHWIRTLVNHNIDYQVVMIHQTTMLYGLSTFEKNIKLVLKSSMTWTHEWDIKVVIYSLRIGLLLIMECGNTYS